MEWTAIVITCPNSSYASAYQKELEKRCQGVASKETLLLVVDDQKSQIGSGGATLNALLVLAEHISAKKGFSVINTDVLDDSRILLIHSGRILPYEPCGLPFVSLPLVKNCDDKEPKVFCLLDFIIDLMSTKIAPNSPSGVWVCSSDMLLFINEIIDFEHFVEADALLLMVPSKIEYAKDHGICELDERSSFLQNIHFKCKENDVIQRCAISDDLVSLVSGVVYLSLKVANTLLALHTISPLDACTYLGYDSGIAPMQLSLFFDFLLAMCPGYSEDKFVNGGIYGHANTINDHKRLKEDKISPDFTLVARKLVYKHFSKFKCKTLLLQGCHTYLISPSHEYLAQILLLPSSSLLLDCSDWKVELKKHTYTKNNVVLGDRVSLINCALIGGFKIGSGSLLQNVFLMGEDVEIGKNCIISGIIIKGRYKLFLKDNLSVTGFLIGRHNTRRCLSILGCRDNIMGNSTLCNVPFEDFKKRTGICDNDLWEDFEEKSLYNARLFPTSSCVNHISCDIGTGDVLSGDNDLLDFIELFQGHFKDPHMLTRWRNSERLSLRDVFSNNLDIEAHMEFKRSVFHQVSCQIIEETLVSNKPLGLQSLYRISLVGGKSQRMLEELDKIGYANHKCAGISARVLANIANLLGEMACGEGGLRSGPASNQHWMEAFRLLEKGDVIGGLKKMSQERKNWLDSKSRMVRAARHYEGASQILIRQAVMSVHKFIQTKSCVMLDLNQWVSCQCPARIDISGGWSDTPPLTYEFGGAVFNAAITVNGLKPIGAQARRIPNMELVIHLENQLKIIGTDLDFMKSYNQPSAAGSLVKACLICSGLVDYPSQISLADQLQSKFKSGFEIKSWSNLPHGSGLGTSSIMAGAILACLWKSAGYIFDLHTLNHAVLYVEQLLTTGGGWQDQVGGLCGGVKLGLSRSCLPLEIEVDHVVANEEVWESFNRRLVLVYTGQTRLAKNLLQNVIRNWYARDEKVLEIIKNLVRMAHLSREAFQCGDLNKLGQCMNQYWELKKALAPGSEPRSVTLMMEALKHRCYGLCMAGAGGGGFMYLLTKKEDDGDNIKKIICQMKNESASVYDASIDEDGITLQVEGQESEKIPLHVM